LGERRGNGEGEKGAKGRSREDVTGIKGEKSGMVGERAGGGEWQAEGRG